MSIRRAWYVACDECGGFPAEISTESVADARRLARVADGYTRVGRRDLCPHCSGRRGYYMPVGGWTDCTPAELAAQDARTSDA